MKRVLQFLFNLLRNLSFIVCLLLGAFAIWSNLNPEGAERMLLEMEANAGSQNEVISFEVITPQSADSNLPPRVHNQRHIVLQIGLQKLFLTLDEFVFAEKISGKEKYLRIHLQDKTFHELRISLTALQGELLKYGLETYHQQSHLINPIKIRGLVPQQQEDSWVIELKPPFAREPIKLPSKDRANRTKEIENLIRRIYQTGQYPGLNGQ